MKFVVLSFLILSQFVLATMDEAEAVDCSIKPPCTINGVDGGSYVLGPKSDASGNPLKKLFVFFHGHNGSGAGVMKNRGLRTALQKAGYILVAPDGPLFNFRGRSTRGWAARHEKGPPRGNRNDISFIENVLKDVSSKIAVDANETVVSGFSSGGSMAWYFACYSKVPLAGVVAVAGGLRRPLPQEGVLKEDGSKAITCPGGARRLIHIHGFTDRQVPLEGRGIRSWHQGDVFEGLSVQRNTNLCGSRPDRVESKGAYWCRSWMRCQSERPVRFCLHPGGHGMPKGWLSQGLNWLKDLQTH